MKIIKLAGMISFIWALTVCTSIAVSVAEETSGQTLDNAIRKRQQAKALYDFYQFNLGTFAELFEWKGFSATLGGYLTHGLLSADTDFSTSMPTLKTVRHVKGDFGEAAFGYAAVCNFYYELPFLKGLGLSVAARYDWLKFKGPMKVNDYQSSLPLGTMLLNYNQHSVSDMTGPSAFLGVTYRF